jgi:creatinine amidohydrolase
MSVITGMQTLAGLSGAGFGALAKDNPVILLPLGSHEDHGPQLPMGDYVLAEVLATRIAEACTAQGVPAFAAPVLPFGVADYFGSTPGGMALSAATFRSVLSELLAGFRRHHLNRIIILNGHGGNAPVIHEVTLAAKLAHGVVIPSFYLWKIARTLMARRLGPGHEEWFGHGGEPLLSLNFALRPGLDMAPPPVAVGEGCILGMPVTGFGTAAFDGVEIDVPAEFDQVPQVAAAPSRELGEAVAAELVTLAVRFVTHYTENSAAF